MKRFILHALPDGFHRIRHYGFLANGHRQGKLTLIRRLLDQPEPPCARMAGNHRDRLRAHFGVNLDLCPVAADPCALSTGCRACTPSESAGAELAFLPPYSPDFNPIENAFAKMKALLRQAAERTVEGLWSAIGRSVGTVIPQECANFFAAAGIDPY